MKAKKRTCHKLFTRCHQSLTSVAVYERLENGRLCPVWFWYRISPSLILKILACFKEMDSLTKLSIITSGINAAKPLLPPVHNMGMVYLQEPLTEAEENLHQSRKALKQLEENDTDENKRALYYAMRHLEEDEAKYVARRYIGHNKSVLRGWRSDQEQYKFSRFIRTWNTILIGIRKDFMEDDFSEDAMKLTDAVVEIFSILKGMDETCYKYSDEGERIMRLPHTNMRKSELESQRNDIKALLGKVYDNVTKAKYDPTREDDTIALNIDGVLEIAGFALEIAETIVNNRWDMPKKLVEDLPEEWYMYYDYMYQYDSDSDSYSGSDSDLDSDSD